ncbi:phosphotransferase [Phytoactinopolyspora mesophila]|uniref:Phosphotransferase n=1 Tax=Phytoactinopolyspora mesophila TaxID=2650750 RepID=A0A7K3MCF0_9ACTN|nr:phosphotransferase [Phytoactinopolyspora mesophila]NDL60860.1 phosphotransferase [Phytoactinopolyspora mesophila]
MHTFLASGRDADVFVVGPGRVLRRYRDGSDVAPEVAVMAHVGRHGFPVPTVFRSEGPDLEMEHLDGTTMLQALVNDDIRSDDAASILADLHRRLHAIPPMGMTSVGQHVLHLDLHPDNVLLTSGGPVLIDWRNAAAGAPELDVALSALILAQVAVEPIDMAPRAAELLDHFLARAPDSPTVMLDDAVHIRAGNPTLTPGELGRLGSAADLLRAKV